MKILCGDEFKTFQGFKKKLAKTVLIEFDNTTLKCSIDHKLKTEKGFVEANDLYIGQEVENTEFGKSIVKNITELNDIQTVITPVEVEGKEYSTPNGLINHNCSFIGSSQTLIDPNVLSDLMQKEPVDYLYDLDMCIYEKPIPGALYVMGVDCATGVGGDYAAIQVIKINGRTDMELVCTYMSNTVTPGKFARIIDQTSKMYNNAYYILENNDVGRQVSEELWYVLENTNLINTDKHGLGTRADKKSKLDACMETKRLIDSRILKVYDANTIAQLSRFEEVSPNVFKGAKGTHDDLVSSLYWGVYATLQPEIDLDSCKTVQLIDNGDKTIDMMVEETSHEDNDNWLWSEFK